MIKKKRSPPKRASLTKKRGKEAVGERGSKERIALRSFLNGDLSSTSMLEKSIPRLNEKSKKKKRSQGSNSSINSKSMLEKPIIDVVVENTGGQSDHRRSRVEHASSMDHLNSSPDHWRVVDSVKERELINKQEQQRGQHVNQKIVETNSDDL